jgi:hypothetical protein
MLARSNASCDDGSGECDEIAGRLQRSFGRVGGTGKELRRAPCWRRSPQATHERFPAKARPGLDPGWAPVRVERSPQRQELESAFRRWSKRYGGLMSPAFHHLKELEIENRRPRALVENSQTGSTSHARKILLQGNSISASGFRLRCSLAVETIRAFARSIPWPVRIGSLYALTLAAPISAVGTMCSMARLATA